jgi:BirA family biotin operon repressor/biotin-[acetyl-CoA-carboxylase] ligase
MNYGNLYIMNLLPVLNPWNAPVYYHETLSSTMDESRRLAALGEPHGTVAAAGYQEAGRGRAGRPWNAEPGKNIFFTVLLRYPNIFSFPQAITLRTGLAVSLAVEDCSPALRSGVFVKWPNDIMIDSRKIAGILTETDGRTVYIGIGVNIAQTVFPEDISAKAGSILLALRTRNCQEFTPKAEILLESILVRLHEELASSASWRETLEKRLYMKGRKVSFFPGGVDAGCGVEGVLSGIGAGGELIIIPEGKNTGEAYVSGELRVY